MHTSRGPHQYRQAATVLFKDLDEFMQGVAPRLLGRLAGSRWSAPSRRVARVAINEAQGAEQEIAPCTTHPENG
jgi:hypothetical protein